MRGRWGGVLAHHDHIGTGAGGHTGMGASAMATVATVKKGRRFSDKPPAIIKNICKEVPSNIIDLNEAFNQVYKIYKYLGGFPLSFRSSTKNMASR